MIVIKRNKTEENLNIMKIITVLHKANTSQKIEIPPQKIQQIANEIIDNITKKDVSFITTEEIKELTEEILIANKLTKLAKAYIIGCYEKEFQKHSSELDKSILDVIDNKNIEVSLENSNKDATLVTTQRDYIAGEVSKSISRRILLDKDVVEAHDKGLIHKHDMDYYVQPLLNCCLVNLEDMFNNGTMIGNVTIETPKSLRTACTIMTQIASSVASNQFGGQTMSIAHLTPYVNISRQKYIKEVKNELEIAGSEYTEDVAEYLAEMRLKKEIKDSIQTINYQLNSFSTTNGQTPFITLFIALNECKNDQEKKDLVLLSTELFRQRIKGMKNKDGVYVTQTFPKLVYVLEEDNISEDAPYWELTELAAKCTAKRMVPDYISLKKQIELKNGCIAPMGCRSFANVTYNDQIYGKKNLGVCSINLAHVALSSKGNPEEFWKILDERMRLLYKAQISRYKKLLGVKSDVAPILWQYGAYTPRLKPGENIDRYLTKEYSTISVGYMGLYEAVKFMTGKSHTDESTLVFAKSILQKLNKYCEEWTKVDNLGWGIYGTPAESLTHKFAQACLRDFGTIDGESKYPYLTNSYHVNVREQIDAFNKLKIESEFQELSTSGAISYIETPNLQDNIPAVLSVLKYIYENIMYAELNCKSDYCYECGFDGEIKSYNTGDEFGWICPECCNKDQNKISIVRRTCGYLGENRNTAGWNKGRFSEINDRILHL